MGLMVEIVESKESRICLDLTQETEVLAQRCRRKVRVSCGPVDQRQLMGDGQQGSCSQTKIVPGQSDAFKVILLAF